MLPPARLAEMCRTRQVATEHAFGNFIALTLWSSLRPPEIYGVESCGVDEPDRDALC
jgi:hypothetical protein